MTFYEMDIFTACALNLSEVALKILNRDGLVFGVKENSKGYTPLMYACANGHEDIVKLLIELKIPLCHQSKGSKNRTALMVAAAADNINILNLIFTEKSLNMQDTDGWTALHHAVYAGQLNSTKFLISKGADIDARTHTGMTPLMMCAADGLTFLAKLLLANGADQHLINCNNESAYLMAFNRNHIAVVQLLQNEPTTELPELLRALNLERYWPIFKKHNIDLSQFLALTEDDLKDLGIGLLGPRRKMAMVISNLNMKKSTIYVQ